MHIIIEADYPTTDKFDSSYELASGNHNPEVSLDIYQIRVPSLNGSESYGKQQIENDKV